MIYLPIGFDITGKYIGHTEVVLWSNYFWWFDYSTTHLFANPLSNTYLFYPIGLDMVDSILPLILFIPITHVFGSVVSYNIYVLTTFILAAYGMYLLVDYLLDDKYIAFVSGLIFAFSPYHFGASFGHLHTFSILWIPFFTLYFFKMYDNPTCRNIIFCSIFFSANALTSWTIGVMMSIFIIIFIIFNYKSYLVMNSPLTSAAKFIILSIVLIMPGLYIMVKNYITNQHMVLGLNNFIHYGADLLGFVVLSPRHPLFGEFTNSIYSDFTGNYSENIVFMGYSVIILSLIGLFNCRKDRKFRLFLISFCVFFILSLGAILHINGVTKFTEFDLSVMLPGVITYYIPVLNMIRVPSRYDLMVMFCIAIIAGYGIRSIFIKFNFDTITKKMLFCSLLSVIILFEFAAVLPNQSARPTPNFYYNMNMSENDSIIELPIIRSNIDSSNGGESMFRYYEYQKLHNGKIFGGYFNRINPVYAQFAQSDPIIKVLYTGINDIYSGVITSSTSYPLKYLKDNFGVKYVVLHENLLSEKDLKELIQYLGNSYTLDNSVNSDKLIIYSTGNIGANTEISHTFSSISLGDGWHGLEDWSGTPTRWIENDAVLLIESEENRTAELSFHARSFYRPRTLEMYAGDALEMREVINASEFAAIKMPVHLKEGTNIMRFHVPGGCERPCDITQLKNPDARCLSLVFHDITVKMY